MGIQSKRDALWSRGARDAFADPLEAAEWRGLHWTIPIAAHFVAGPAQTRIKPEKSNQYSGLQRRLSPMPFVFADFSGILEDVNTNKT